MTKKSSVRKINQIRLFVIYMDVCTTYFHLYKSRFLVNLKLFMPSCTNII